MTMHSDFFIQWRIPKNIHEMLLLPIDQPKEILLQCKNWMKDDKPFCILAGDNGTGKTTLACHMMKAWMENQNAVNLDRSPSARFIKQTMLYHRWLDEMRSGSVYMLIQECLEFDIIIIDDLGVKEPAPGWREWLICLIDERLDSMKKTIITTNLDGKAVQKFYGETMLSRILVGTQIKLTGKDRRIKG